MAKTSFHETLYYLKKRAVMHHGADDHFFSGCRAERLLPKIREARRTKFRAAFQALVDYLSKIQGAQA